MSALLRCWWGIRPVASRGAGGVALATPPSPVNPISNRGGQIMPTTVLQALPDFQTLRRPWVIFHVFFFKFLKSVRNKSKLKVYYWEDLKSCCNYYSSIRSCFFKVFFENESYNFFVYTRDFSSISLHIWTGYLVHSTFVANPFLVRSLLCCVKSVAIDAAD